MRNCRPTGKWTIGYIGANQDVGKVAERYGLLHANCAVYSDQTAQTAGAAYSHSNKRARSYFASRGMGVSAFSNLMNDADAVADLTNLKGRDFGD